MHEYAWVAVYSLMILTESIAVTYNDLRWVLFVIVATRLALPEREPERDSFKWKPVKATVTL